MRLEVEDLEGRTGILAASFLREVLGDGLRRWLFSAVSIAGCQMIDRLGAEKWREVYSYALNESLF